ncbi:MarR family winged helix-turn-helix transcriptional regulator [Paraburkholderia sp. HD33-4]|uniref:MarR family winged helix-turn-helix transcriptional regulator n=1 Tax=Paraburkholderia sp. HD33-4 TaxID=2883242 RepID=UPI001F2ECD07|nr:MarR family transcriptional regulator [Paraburkholderia sp. HD33-4]
MIKTMEKGRTPVAKQAGSTKTGAPPARVSYVVGQLDRLLKRSFIDVLGEFGLTLPQFTALSVISASGAMTNAKLAERSFITPQSANEVVKTMEANGWVGRAGHPTHGRLIHLFLTDEGRRVLKECDSAIDTLEASMLDGVTEIPVDTLRKVLQRCVSNLRG